jgi:hypothetical protein
MKIASHRLDASVSLSKLANDNANEQEDTAKSKSNDSNVDPTRLSEYQSFWH